ncbi:hypothetical protein [Agrobacterium tumefaciens]|uniref:hypothetical protein n=1 Tax=Agrobacterium tumefaciens TaxID=358 RepID=UPI0009763DF7|nr:hypothetical protein BV900_19470 [Agrobacterium tumefaciens]
MLKHVKGVRTGEMGKLFSLLFFGVFAVLAYGYYDANRQTPADGNLRVSVTTPWGLYFDSHEAYSPMENGQLFLKVTWQQPDKDRRISSIHVKGTVVDGETTVESFDAPCERAGSSWLGAGKWTWQGGVSTDRVCFVRLKKILAPTTVDGLVKMDEADARIANMRVNYTGTVKAVNKPVRFVSWINETAASSYQSVSNAISAPFQRQ